MKARLLWEDLKTSLWFRPAFWIGGMFVLALLLLELDQRLTAGEVALELPWLWVDSPDGARTMLGAIASAMLTVATLAFSIIMVAVVQTANAYSPRILREYLADEGNQHVLGVLIGVFVYAIVVLRRVQDSDQRYFIPMISISVGLLLALGAVLAFIYFINHVAHSIEVAAIVQRLKEETEEVLGSYFPLGVGQPWQGTALPALPDGPATQIRSRSDGYVEAIAGEELLEALSAAGGVVRIEKGVGAYVLPGGVLAHLWPANAPPKMVEAVHTAFTLGRERTTVQDLHHGLRQLSDIALRALSPAINDPSTAINCLDVLAALLARAATRPDSSPYRCDASGTLRIIAPASPTFASLLRQALGQIRHYGASDAVVALRLIEVCGDLAQVVEGEERRTLLWEEATHTARIARAHLSDPVEQARLTAQLQHTAARLGQEDVEGALAMAEVAVP